MRIFNRKQFLKTPDNTLFCKVDKDRNLDELCIKSESWEADFTVINLNEIEHTSCEDHLNKSVSMYGNSFFSNPMDFESSGRDGLFDEDQMFAVYENDDVKKLILRLALCLDPSKGGILKDRNYLLNVESTDDTKVTISIPCDAEVIS